MGSPVIASTKAAMRISATGEVTADDWEQAAAGQFRHAVASYYRPQSGGQHLGGADRAQVGDAACGLANLIGA